MATVAVDLRPLPHLAPAPSASRSTSTSTNGKHIHVDKENISYSTRPGTAADSARARRERPCDACRRRKSRCVIHEGKVLCVLCEFHRQDCTFVQSPLPRKRKLSGDGKKVGTIKRRATVPTYPERRENTCLDIQIKEEPGPQSAIVASVRVEDSIGVHKRRHCRYIGKTTPYDGTLIGLSQFDEHNESILDIGTLRKVNDHDCFIMYSDAEMQRDASDDAGLLREIHEVVAPHGPALVRLYFRTVHPSYPVIQKQLFLERVNNNDWQFTPALLAAMYILSIGWWDSDPETRQYVRPDLARLEEIATRALNLVMLRPKLASVQAGLLLLQRADADSWSLTTQLVATGQELGLHLDCSDWEIPQWERSLRQRVAWALYMQDKWSSLIHGRPSHIFDANWAVRRIASKDFVEEPHPYLSDEEKEDAEKGQTVFTQMIQLTSIMATIMDTFYTQSAISDFDRAGKNATRLILERAKPVQLRLKEWFANLPVTCRMDQLVGGRASSTGYLHLAYFATEITLHRRIVQSLSPAPSDANLLYICRSAAKTRLISAMDFVNRLKPQHLESYWYFASKVNFTLIGTFGSLLWATAPAQEEADFYKARLREYRWTLSVSARRAIWLEYAVQMLDATTGLVGKSVGDKPSFRHTGSVETTLLGAPLVGDNVLAVLPRPSTQAFVTDEDLRPVFMGQEFTGFPMDEAMDGYDSDMIMEEDED